MKKLSLILNIVLFILVGVLFYLHFSGQKETSASLQNAPKDSPSTLPLAYVNVDSLEAHYSYFQVKKAELDKKQESIQKELSTKANAIQQDIAKLQKDAPTLTQAQGEAAQKKILDKRQKLQDREQQLRQEFLQQQQAFNQTLHERLNKFLERYNANKRYVFIFSYSSSVSDLLYKDRAYDITQDVIKGLNATATNDTAGN